MSKKYVPTFLKNQDFQGSKPIVNTSRPAMEAPKLVPATLASLTSNGADRAAIASSGRHTPADSEITRKQFPRLVSGFYTSNVTPKNVSPSSSLATKKRVINGQLIGGINGVQTNLNQR
jgi:hypothetical protein